MNDKNIYVETEQTPVIKQDAAAAYLVEMAKQNSKPTKASASGKGSEDEEVPIWERYILTIREASIYFHIGEKRLRAIVEENPLADFVVMNGNRSLIKRKLFEKFIDESSVV